MHKKAPFQAPGETSSELEGVEGTLPTLGNQASEASLTTERTTMENFHCLAIYHLKT